MVINSECVFRDRCRYLNFQAADKVLAERDYLSKRVLELEAVMRLAEIKILGLQKELNGLKQEKATLLQELSQACRRPFKSNKKESVESPVKNKHGAPPGHRGATRKKPVKIDEYVDVYPRRCEHCGNEKITVYSACENHLVEDLAIRVKTTCFRHHYGYCPHCQKVIYTPAEVQEIPKSHIGPVARAVSGYLRYIGIPYRKTQKIFKNIFGLELSHPSLLGFDTKMGEQGAPLYERIKSLVRHSSVIHGDETGWRVDGVNHWLWSFTNKDVALYRIERSRGSKVVEETLGKHYGGVLISDFYAAYNKLEALAKQRCVGHLLAKIKKIQEKNKFPSDSIDGIFYQALKAALKQTIDVWNGYHEGTKIFKDLSEGKERAVSKIIELLLLPTEHKDVRCLRKRIIKYNHELFTFLENPKIEPTNNHAERQLRPNVIMRKITFGNRSDTGTRNHQVIMSIIQTSILNGIEPFNAYLSLVLNQNLLFTNQKTRAP